MAKRLKHYRHKLLLEELEPRLLFSAGLASIGSELLAASQAYTESVPLVASLTPGASGQAQVASSAVSSSFPSPITFDFNHGQSTATATDAATQLNDSQSLNGGDYLSVLADPLVPQAGLRLTSANSGLTNTPASQQPALQAKSEVVFLDVRVQGYEQMLADIQKQNIDGDTLDAVLIDAQSDGIAQISDYLSRHHDIDAVHIISHGSDGSVQLGSTNLNMDSLLQSATQIKSWGNALTGDADILLYGCDVAEHADGKALVDALARLTGADVAASEDLTGSAQLGGDWNLEYQNGAIETVALFSQTAPANWTGLLAPPSLTWMTFAGGAGQDLIGAYGNSVAVDGSGNIYVIGSSDATWGSPVLAFGGGANDTFVAKYTSSGSLVWNTFLGGAGNDSGCGISEDGSGNVYVVGYSSATWGAPAQAYSGGTDTFVAKLSSSGALNWNTFLGGAGNDYGFGVAVDGGGNVYVGGYSTATWGSPVRANGGGTDGFVAKLNNSGTLTWNSFAGGAGSDYGWSVAVDTGGNVYLSGNSSATWGTPVTAFSSGDDGYASKFDSTGNLTWNTFLGGSGTDSGNGIAVDGSGNVYVGGDSSATWGSPVQAFSGTQDTSVAKLNSSGTLQWNTFLGGSGTDNFNGIAVDGSGNVYVGGNSNATWGASPWRAYSGWDVFAASLNSGGSLLWNGFLGGAGTDGTGSIAADSSGNVYVAGYSTSTWGSPLNPVSTANDVFVTKIATDVSANTAPTLDASKSPTLTTQNEDSGTPVGVVGTLISSLVDFASPSGQVDNITDADAGALLGIAVTAADTTNGTWWYTTNNGSTWTALGAVTDTSALLLAADANSRIYFQPDGNYNGTIATAITFRAWDQTSGSNGATADTSSNGVTTAFSSAVDSASLVVNAVNDRPVAINQGLSFDGINDKVVVAASASLQMTSALTIEAWIQPQAIPTIRQMILNKEGEYELALSVTGTLELAIANSSPGWSWVDTGYKPPVGQWTHIAVTYDGSTIDAYANGVLVHSLAGSGAFGDAWPTMNDLTLGSRQDGADSNFQGMMDEVRIWNVARTGAQILANYDQTLTGSEAGLVGYWQFAEGSGSTLLDTTANGNNGILGGGAASAEPSRLFTYSVAEDGLLSISGPGVLANASDAEGSALTAVLVSGPSHAASFSLNSDGSFSYTPAANYNGSDSFVFQVSDGALLSTPATVSLSITPVNDAPTTTPVTLSAVAEDSGTRVITQTELLANAADVDGPSLTATTLAIASGSGTLVDNGDGTWNYTPALNDDTSVSFSYTVTDGTLTAAGSATLDITPVNDAPVITSNGGGSTASTAVAENTTAVTTVTASDVDLPAPTLTYSIVGGVNAAKFTIDSSTGALSFISPPDYENPQGGAGSGYIYDVTVGVSDGALTSTQAISIIVWNVNDAPVVTTTGTALGYTENDAPAAVDPSVTVSDQDSTNLVSATVTISSNYVSGQDVLAFTDQLGIAGNWNAGTGVLTLTGTSSVANYQTALRSVTYVNTSDNPSALARTVSFVTNDSTLASNAVARIVNITPVNDAPIATNLSAAETYTEDTPLNLTGIVVSDVDSANMTMTLTLSDAAAGSLNTGTAGAVTSTFAGGIWSASGAISDVNTLLSGLTYTPSPNYNSNFTIATSVSDGTATPVTGLKNIAGIAVNDAPVAIDNNFTINEDGGGFLPPPGILGNDYDVDSGSLTTVLVSNVTHGTLTLNSNGSVWYWPDSNYNGTDSFTYKVYDGALYSNVATVTYTINPVNDAPTATNLGTPETYTEDTAHNLSAIVVNDIDSPNVTVTLTMSDTAVGSLNTGTAGAVTSTFVGGVWTASGAIADVNMLLSGVTFTPSLNYNSNFTIATSVSDGVATPVTGVKTVTGIAVNDAPVLATPIANTSILQDVILNTQFAAGTFLDAEGDALSYTASMANGAALPAWLSFDAATRSFTGKPGNGDVGDYIIRITAADGNGAQAITTFTLSVINVNDAPIAQDDSATTVQDSVVIIAKAALMANDSDIDGDTLTVVGFSQPQYGTLVDHGYGTLYYTPSAQFIGSDSFTYTVSDGNGGLHSATVSLMVTPAPITVLSGSMSPDTSTDNTPNVSTLPPVADAPIATDQNNQDSGGMGSENSDTVSGDLPLRLAHEAEPAPMAATEPTGSKVQVNGDGNPTAGPSAKTVNVTAQVSGQAQALINIGPRVIDRASLSVSLRAIEDQITEMSRTHTVAEKLSVHIIAGTSLTLSAGFVAWVLRGGSLLASFMSTLPLWKGFDPLPILAAGTLKETVSDVDEHAREQETRRPDPEDEIDIFFREMEQNKAGSGRGEGST